ncbi:MAG: class I SAM-dependent methyltransferase [Kofleriaceae bacterium]|nr:class I SAM-dependent methyltransferase [Kofleriaceae bacterium]
MSDERTCPSCASGGTAVGAHESGSSRWTCFACGTCELQYWSPREIIPEFYADPAQVNYARRRQGEIFLRERHKMFLRRASPGRLFDVGCGEGGFLAAARDQGFEVAGIDLDPGSAEIARGRGLEVNVGFLFDDAGALHDGIDAARPYDWVTAFEVLEHQADPLHFLRLVKGLLAEGGTLCGSVPNRDRFLVAADRARNSGDRPPHHFLYFSATSLETLLRAAGFKHVEVLPLPETDLTDFATYIEVATTGGLSRRMRESAANAAHGGARQNHGASRSWRRHLKQAARVVKNLPFYPAALAVRTLAPRKARGLYFEASFR